MQRCKINCISAFFVLVHLARLQGGILALVEAEENGRVSLIKEAWQNFLSAPVFGVGLGAPGVQEVGFMSVNWTHNIIFQVLGSLGFVGVLAYGYQLYSRAKIILAHPSPFHLAAGLSYLGIFLISMFQPGEFCPMPYAMMAVMIFSVLETVEEEALQKAKNDEKTDGSS